MKLAPQQQRGDRLGPLSPECIAAEIESVWLRLANLPSWRPAVIVYVTRRGHVIYGSEVERYANAVEVGTYDRRISLQGLRDDVFHALEELHR